MGVRFRLSLPEGCLPPAGGSQLQMIGRRGCWPRAYSCFSLTEAFEPVRLRLNTCAQLGDSWRLTASNPTSCALRSLTTKEKSKNRSPHPPLQVSLTEASGFAASLWAFSIFLGRQIGRVQSSREHRFQFCFSASSLCEPHVARITPRQGSLICKEQTLVSAPQMASLRKLDVLSFALHTSVPGTVLGAEDTVLSQVEGWPQCVTRAEDGPWPV